MEKTFTIPGRTYYAEDLGKKDNEIYINFYDEESGKQADFNIEWVDLSNKMAPRLRMFHDCWTSFSMIPELFTALESVDNMNPSIDVIANILKSCGFVDNTAYKIEVGEQTIKQLQSIRDQYFQKVKDITKRIERLTK